MTDQNSPTYFNVVDGQTGRVVGTAKSRKRANATADRKDNEYGAVRYRVVAVYSEGSQS